MKKICFVTVAALISFIVHAQRRPVWGLKAGINLSNWKTEDVSMDDDGLDSRLGLHVGLLAHKHLSNVIAFQPEIQYSKQGVESEDDNVDYKMDYINVPLMLQYMFNNGFRIEAGPQVGFLINAEDEAPNGTERNAKGDYKKTDFAIGVGLNYLTYSGFGIGGRYNFGVSNINDRLGPETYNRVLQISVFYMFDNDHKARSR